MIYLGKIKACSNPDCRLVLPADLDAPWDAGFWVSARRDGRATRFFGRCKDCTRAARGRNKRRRAETWMVEFEGKLVPRRRCLECGFEGYCLDDPRSDFTIKGYSPSLRWAGICKRCYNKRQNEARTDNREARNRRRREIHRERMENDPAYREAKRRESLRQYHAHPEKVEARRAANRRYREKKKREDPTKFLEMARIDRRLRAERAGTPARVRKTVIDGTKPVVNAEPFRKWLVAYGRAAEIGQVAEFIAKKLGLIPRKVWGVLNSQYESVAMDTVSRALTNSMIIVFVDGRPIVTIDDLYPEGLPRG